MKISPDVVIIIHMIVEIFNPQEMQDLGQKIGQNLKGGEVIELIGDVGAGKTTFVKGLALGLEIYDEVQSPSFTISRKYIGREDIELAHYDFYRLQDAGIMKNEIEESIHDKASITVVEWADVISGVLPSDRIIIHIESTGENTRRITIEATDDENKTILDTIK